MRSLQLLGVALLLSIPTGVVSDGTTVSIGVTGRNFVVLATETGYRRGPQIIGAGCDHMVELGPRLLLSTVGEVASADEFSSYLARNLALSSMVSESPVSTRAAAHFARREVARLLRRAPIQADLLLAGVDRVGGAGAGGDGAGVGLGEDRGTGVVDGEGGDGGSSGDADDVDVDAADAAGGGCASAGWSPQLHWIDRTGATAELPYAAHGHAAPMALAVLDEGYEADMELEQALSLVRRCIKQLDGRYAVRATGWRIKLVDAEGCRVLE